MKIKRRFNTQKVFLCLIFYVTDFFKICDILCFSVLDWNLMSLLKPRGGVAKQLNIINKWEQWLEPMGSSLSLYSQENKPYLRVLLHYCLHTKVLLFVNEFPLSLYIILYWCFGNFTSYTQILLTSQSLQMCPISLQYAPQSWLKTKQKKKNRPHSFIFPTLLHLS